MPTLSDTLARSPWVAGLTPLQLQRVCDDMLLRDFAVGAYVCRKGETCNQWIGVLDGLVKLHTINRDGKSITFAGIPAGSWFGEGSVLKREDRKYDVIALRESRVAFVPETTFHWLLDQSIPFNRFVLNQLNERLSYFIGMIENDRLLDPDARVARALASLYHPYLYPSTGPRLQLSQEELGYLAGASRQRVNQALQVLSAAGLVRVEYGYITVLDLSGLRAFGS